MSQNFFTIEEVFARLGQNREKGCLVVFNPQRAIHLFVDKGFVTGALANQTYSEVALPRALEMENARYSWIEGAEPVTRNLEISIQGYLLKHAIGKDTKIGTPPAQPKTATKVLPKEEAGQQLAVKRISLDITYYFTNQEAPTIKIKLPKISNILGREETCDVILADPQISRKHCIVQVTERGLLVKDLDSANGTFANGILMTDGYINRGDRLSLGRYDLQVHVEGKKSPKPA